MIRRRKGMKLDQALKLYIALYCVCFMLTWLISVPMLIHVTPQSECLLFVTPYVKYGNPASKFYTEIFTFNPRENVLRIKVQLMNTLYLV